MYLSQTRQSNYCIWVAICALATFDAILGAVVKKDLAITWERWAPNGQPRYMILTNGQFPAPSLIFDENDDIEAS
jgi:hypothetical protein